MRNHFYRYPTNINLGYLWLLFGFHDIFASWINKKNIILFSTVLVTVTAQFLSVNLLIYVSSTLFGLYHHADPASVDFLMRYIQEGYHPIEWYNFALAEEGVSTIHEIQFELRARVESTVVRLDECAPQWNERYQAKIEFLEQHLNKKPEPEVESWYKNKHPREAFSKELLRFGIYGLAIGISIGYGTLAIFPGILYFLNAPD